MIIITILLLLGIVYVIYLYLSTSAKRSSSLTKIPLKILRSDYDRYTIIDMLRWAAKEYPSYEALKYKNKTSRHWKSINYSEYYHNVMTFSSALRASIDKSRPRVAIIGFNSPEWFYAHLGTMASRGVSIGMYPTSDPKTCEYIINQTSTDVLVVEDTDQMKKFVGLNIPSVKLIVYYGNVLRETLDKMEESNKDVKVIKYLNLIRERSDEKSQKKRKVDPNDIATIIYTSGTTGSPKGAVIKHSNIIDMLNNMILTIHTKSNIDMCVSERMISYLPLNHIAAQMMDIYVPIVTLGTVHFAQRDALKGSLAKTIKEVRPTVFIGVPRVWEKIMEKLNERLTMGADMASLVSGIILSSMGLDQCKYAITAAAPITTETRDFFDKFGLHLCDVYGMSETTGPISVSMPGRSKPGSVGVPLIHVKIAKDGEILVKGKSVFSEYYNNEQATKNSFHNEWFKTGDLGRLDEDGYLYITGRTKDILVTAGGENISPVPIEDRLSTHLSKYCDHIMVVGDKRKFLSVMLVPKHMSMDSNKHHSCLKEFGTDLTKSKEFCEIVDNAITDINRYAPSNSSKVQKWMVLDRQFRVGEELTPTLKVRRLSVQNKYSNEIDEMYK